MKLEFIFDHIGPITLETGIFLMNEKTANPKPEHFDRYRITIEIPDETKLNPAKAEKIEAAKKIEATE